jgi:HlyD family secretion protein
MNPMKKISLRNLLIIAAFIIAFVKLLFWTTHNKPENPVVGMTVTSVVAEKSNLTQSMVFSGPIIGHDEVPIFSDLEQGRISQTLVESGNYVKQGQVLAKIDNAQYNIKNAQALANQERTNAQVLQQETTLEQAKAEYELAKNEASRAKDTLQIGLISKEIFEQKLTSETLAKSKVALAQSALAMAKAEAGVAGANLKESSLKLDQTTIKAPVSGLIVQRNAKAGMLLGQGNQPLFVILPDTHIEIELEVPADEAPLLKVGMPVSIELNSHPEATSVPSQELNVSPHPSEDINQLIEAWKTAWQKRDVTNYLSFYADNFYPEGGLSKSAWKSQRTARLSAQKDIKIELSSIKIKVQGTHAIADFHQHYQAGNKTDSSNKRLLLTQFGQTWKITRERSISDKETLEMDDHSFLDEPNLNGSRSGQSSISGTVTQAATEINRSTQIAKVRVGFNRPPKVILGQFAKVVAHATFTNKIFLPANAIRFEGQSTYVLVVNAGIVKRQLVELGQHVGDKVEILAGINPGMVVVDSAASLLMDGEHVTLANHQHGMN